MQDQTPIFQVSELNEAARQLLENQFPHIVVEGEISNFSAPQSGHWYFSLKDSDAQVRCAMFRFQNRQIKAVIKDGMQVVVKAKVSLYPGRGDFQLIVSELQEQGYGALQRQFEALKAKLDKAGLFAAQHKKPLPSFCHRIAVITSDTGAALHDVLTTLQRRYALADVLLYPSAVQGKAATSALIHAIEQANQDNKADVILLVRGGGSLEDLWCFNEEAVAQAIFASQIPIVSGVGHEVDFTIADFVADHRCATPTAAAEWVTPNTDSLQQQCQHRQQQLQRSIETILRHHRIQIQHLDKQLQAQHPKQRLQHMAQQLDYLQQSLQTLMTINCQKARNQFEQLVAKLHAFSPLQTLSRGYSISMVAGKAITSISKAKAGDTLITTVSDGDIVSLIKRTSEKS